MSPRKRGWSDITVTDQFCGAGGSSIGAVKAGLRLRMAMNHWSLAVETHNTNFPNTDHDCCDVSAADPRRYPSTDILITSPECTTHSPAGGNRRDRAQRDMFVPTADDPAAQRSRATMRDVPRFAEYHLYRRMIVENVVEVTRWPLFHHWLREMELLGYRWQLVSLNSMFCWPTPQSRDRLYVVFWRKGDRAPNLSITPSAPCPRCETIVASVQTWKQGALQRAIAGQPVGKYRFQYVYTCPACRTEVTPFYFAALNAIDFSLAAERIGDRAAGRELKPRTIERIRYGLEKYGRRQLVIRTNMTSGVDCRVRGLEEPHFSQTASWLDGLLSPSLLLHMHADGLAERVRDPRTDSMATQTARQDFGFVVPIQGMTRALTLADPLPTQVAECSHDAVISGAPFLAALRGTDHAHRGAWAIGGDEPIGTVSAGGVHHALIGPAFLPFIAMRRGNMTVKGANEPVPTVLTGETQHLLVQGAAQTSLRDTNAMRVAGLDAEMMAQGCAPQQALLSRAPFVATLAFEQQSRGSQARGVEEPMASVVGNDRDALVEPRAELRVEDCYFRMLQPHEIGRAMAFPTDYTVLGNKRDRVKQYGNAVTPPAMSLLIERQVAAMTGERAA